MKVFIDANILIEFMLKRKNFITAESFLLGSSDDLCISMLTVHLVHHFGHKAGISMKLIYNLISNFTVLLLTPVEYDIACSFDYQNDFEDNLQVACCFANQCKVFYTFDQSLYRCFRYFGIIKLLK